MSASSIAARVLIALNFSMPTSRFPGFLRPAVSKISISLPLYLMFTRLMSRVVPCLLLMMACCFLPRALNRLDLPTFGRPIKAILRSLDFSFVTLFPRIFSTSDFSSAVHWPVVAEVRRMRSSGMPRARKSLTGKASPLSDLFKSKKTGFLDLKADLAIFLS